MVWKRANSTTWKLATGKTLSCQTHVFLHVKAVIKRKIICNFPYLLIRQQDNSDFNLIEISNNWGEGWGSWVERGIYNHLPEMHYQKYCEEI